MPNQWKERILLGGESGAGKTYACLTIAAMYPERKFHVIDLDDGWMPVQIQEFSDLANVEYYRVLDWTALMATLKELKPGPDDWVVVDMLVRAWEMVQNHFVNEVFNKDIGSYFLEARKMLKQNASNLGALRGWTDWPVINKMHSDFINTVVYSWPCNLLATTSMSPLTEVDDAEVQHLMTNAGLKLKFDGQKNNPFRFHTTLVLSQDRKGHYITTCRDRGRPRLERQLFKNFAREYGMKIAGWE